MSNLNSVIKYRQRVKQRCVESFGGKCGICGYSKCISALEFHHTDPSVKESQISLSNTRKWEKVVCELKKCVMVCSNCHREIHSGITKIPKDIPKFNDDYLEWDTFRKKPNKKACKICGNEYIGSNKYYCSKECKKKEMTRRYPSYKTVLQEVAKEGYTKTARKYGVSDNAVRKFLKNNQKL
jgi:hypothetical protein